MGAASAGGVIPPLAPILVIQSAFLFNSTTVLFFFFHRFAMLYPSYSVTRALKTENRGREILLSCTYVFSAPLFLPLSPVLCNYFPSLLHPSLTMDSTHFLFFGVLVFFFSSLNFQGKRIDQSLQGTCEATGGNVSV